MRPLQRFVRTVGQWALGVLPLSAAYSCPLCHTPIGEQVRAGIFNGNFGWNLIALALPFPIFAVVIVWLYRGKPTPGNRQQ